MTNTFWTAFTIHEVQGQCDIGAFQILVLPRLATPSNRSKIPPRYQYDKAQIIMVESPSFEGIGLIKSSLLYQIFLTLSSCTNQTLQRALWKLKRPNKFWPSALWWAIYVHIERDKFVNYQLPLQNWTLHIKCHTILPIHIHSEPLTLVRCAQHTTITITEYKCLPLNSLSLLLSLVNYRCGQNLISACY